MSLTQHIKSKTEIYHLIVSCLNLEHCLKLVNYHNNSMKVVHRPVQGTQFPIAGMGVIVVRI